MHVGAISFSLTASLGVWPSAGTVTVSLESSAPQTSQYTTKSYDPAVVHVGATSFSLTASFGVCPSAAISTSLV